MANQSKMREFSWGNDDVKEALQKLRDKQMNAVANAYPSYEQVRPQLHRRRKEACRAIKDPFNLPPAFQQTYRASVTGEEER
jgi:hypothetical protein